jgi:hypothetical protein
VRNLGSTKWDDHEMVKVILRSLVFLNPTQVQLIRGDPRYKLISPEEVIGKFVSFELMIKGSKQIIERGATSTPEVQPSPSKRRRRRRKSLRRVGFPSTPPSSIMRRWCSSSRASIKSSSNGRGETTNPVPRRFATSVVSPVISLLNVHYQVIVIGATTRREEGRKRRSTTRRRVAMPMFVGSGTPMKAPPTPPSTRTPQTSPSTRVSSSPTSATNAAWQRTTKKVKSRASTKYATSSDEDNSSDDEDSLLALFSNINMQQKEKLNELIGAIHEKDELLDSQEDFLIKENKKHVKI